MVPLQLTGLYVPAHNGWQDIVHVLLNGEAIASLPVERSYGEEEHRSDDEIVVATVRSAIDKVWTLVEKLDRT